MDVSVNLNAAGLNCAGSKNPNWHGGPLHKVCVQCGAKYTVPRNQILSRFCSLQCVGKSQRGRSIVPRIRRVTKNCLVCGRSYEVFSSCAHRYYCCSRRCQGIRRAKLQSGEANPNWNNGSSLLPYPYNWKEISKSILERDGHRCWGPGCRGKDRRLTAHHIDYDKENCNPSNLIALCSSCNTLANFNRPYWKRIYQDIIAVTEPRRGEWKTEEFPVMGLLP